MTKGDKRKPRNEYIYATTAGEVSEFEVIFDPITGGISFGSDVINTYSTVTYEREKGEKVLSRVPQSSDCMLFDQDEALEKDYDFRCAVDTNTRTIHGKRVSVVGVVVFETVFVPEGESLGKCWRYDSPFCFEFVEIEGSPENFGWVETIKELAHQGNRI